jgi:hypothetical protein
MANLKRAAIKFSIGAAAAVLVMQGASLIQRLRAAKQIHVAPFARTAQSPLLSQEPRSIGSGRVLAAGPEFADTIDIVVSGDWLLALRLQNRLIGLNLRHGTVRDFSGILAKQRPVEYHQMWRGRREGEVFVGNIAQRFTQLSVTAEGVTEDTTSFTRPPDVRYSLPVGKEEWLSNGYFRDDATLVSSQLVSDQLKTLSPIRHPVFPGISPFVSLEANKNSVAARPDGRRVAQAFWFAPFVHIYDSSGELLHSIPTSLGMVQEFGEHLVHGDVRMRYLPETVRCYVAVATTSVNVIALFSGKTMKEAGPNPIAGSQLHILNWDGAVTDVVNLDAAVSGLAASAKGELLWAIRRGQDAAILEYALPGRDSVATPSPPIRSSVSRASARD